MDNIKIVRGQRLEKVLETLGINRSSLIDELKFPSSNLSLIIKGKRDIPRKLLDGLSNWKPEINIEWLLTGEGQMLKSKKIDEKSRNECEPMEAEQTFFPSNLRILLEHTATSPDNLALLIRADTTLITDLLNGSRRPSLSLIIRLRNALNVPIDDLLFSDFTQEGVMDNLKENNRLEAMLQAVLKRLEKLEQKEKEREEEANGKDRTKEIDQEK